MDVKDIDFDELDRAVNSVISKNNFSNDNSSATTPVLSDESTTNIVPEQRPTPDVPVFPNRQTISRPATGRFMDMVHSSSNMRVSVPERPALRPVSSPIPTTPIVNAPVPSLTDNTMKNDNSDVDIDRISDEIDKTLSVNANEVQESPFLSGAKVEKRPLNAFVSQQSIDQTASTEPIKVAQVDDMLGSQEKVETPLPAELQNDLLSIEASEVAKMDEIAIPDDIEGDSPETTDSQDITYESEAESPYTPTEQNNIVDREETTDNIVSDLSTKLTSPSTQNPIAATSIPQQYTELPSTEEKEIGSIYDTNSYHKAMAPLPKKKSGWMWVIWIALLMIVSVGAGVAVYFFVLPQL